MPAPASASALLDESPVEHVERDGFGIVPGVILPAQQQELISVLGPVASAGRRGLLADPHVAALAHSPAILALVRPFLPETPRPVRAIYFDKSPEANWLVAWHQDLTLALKERCETPGFGPWSVKDGIPHVQPPVALLAQMITVRLHLDDADESNGALRVLPRSHKQGRLGAAHIQAMRRETAEHTCCAKAGDALLMRPLLLHASGRSSSPSHRRVLHLEYAGFGLPPGLAWAEEAPC